MSCNWRKSVQIFNHQLMIPFLSATSNIHLNQSLTRYLVKFQTPARLFNIYIPNPQPKIAYMWRLGSGREGQLRVDQWDQRDPAVSSPVCRPDVPHCRDPIFPLKLLFQTTHLGTAQFQFNSPTVKTCLNSSQHLLSRWFPHSTLLPSQTSTMSTFHGLPRMKEFRSARREVPRRRNLYQWIPDCGQDQMSRPGWSLSAMTITFPCLSLRNLWWTARRCAWWQRQCSPTECHSEARLCSETSRSDLQRRSMPDFILDDA